VNVKPIVQNNETAVYPNPAQNTLNFKNLSADIATVEVSSMDGKLVSSGKLENASYSVEELANGQYMVVLKNKLGVAVSHSKFLKN
jgi:hypothetical protein